MVKTQQTMLTAHDLHQISLLLDQKFDKKLAPVHEKLDRHEERFNAVDKALEGLDRRLNVVDTRLNTIDHRLNIMDKKLTTLDKKLPSLKKDQVLILDTLDREQLSQPKRLESVETYLGLPNFV
jgi:hypothetical protein